MTAPTNVAGSSADQVLPATHNVASSQGEGEQTATARPETDALAVDSSAGHPHQLVITVLDTPKPQGSKKGFVNKKTGRAQIVDDNKTALRTWREAVKQAALHALRTGPEDEQGMAQRNGLPLDRGPVSIEITFTLTKPASAPKTRVTWPKGRPDVDKLVRSTFDALTAAAVWKDDAQVVELVARKVYPDEGIDALSQPGALIRIWPVTA